MGEQNDARREIAAARSRITDLAVELSRRAEPDYVKARVKEFANEKRDELKARAKETTMRKTTEWKDQVTHSPRSLGMLGAILGAGAGSYVMKKAFLARDRSKRSVGSVEEISTYPTSLGIEVSGVDVEAYGVEPSSGGSGGDGSGSKLSQAKASVSDTLHGVRERASSKADQVRESAHHLRERVPSPGVVKHKASAWYSRALNEQPLAVALGTLALGAIASALIPVSAKERKMMQPAKREAEGALANLGGQVEQKLKDSREPEREENRPSETGPNLPLPPLDELTHVH